MVDRILQMFDQFLISNQTLQLNETFKVFLKVLSVEHMNSKKNEKNEYILKGQVNFTRKTNKKNTVLDTKLQSATIIFGL